MSVLSSMCMEMKGSLIIASFPASSHLLCLINTEREGLGDHVVMSGRQREDTGGVTDNNNSCRNFPGVVNDEW